MKLAGDFGTVGYDRLGGRGWSWRAGVGDEIRDCEIGLVADPGDDGHGARVHGAGNYLFVERPEFLDGAAAAGEDDDIDAAEAVELADCLGDSDCGLGALHRGGGEDDLGERPAAGEDVGDVVEDRTGRRGDDAYTLGKGGQGALASFVEEAVGGELFL